AGLQLVLAVAMVVKAHPALEDVDEEEVELGVLVLGDRRLRARHTLDHVRVVRAAGGLLDAELTVEELRTRRAVVGLDRRERRVLDVLDQQRLLEPGFLHGSLRIEWVTTALSYSRAAHHRRWSAAFRACSVVASNATSSTRSGVLWASRYAAAVSTAIVAARSTG